MQLNITKAFTYRRHGLAILSDHCDLDSITNVSNGQVPWPLIPLDEPKWIPVRDTLDIVRVNVDRGLLVSICAECGGPVCLIWNF